MQNTVKYITIITGSWLLSLVLYACVKKGTVNDQLAIDNGLKMARAIVECHRQNAEYPASLADAGNYLPKDIPWPVNPYTGEPVKDTCSMDFSAESPGNLYYAKVMRDEQISNFSIVVFGQRGILKTWSQAELRIGSKNKGNPLSQ